METSKSSIDIVVEPNTGKSGTFVAASSFYVHLEAGETVRLAGCTAASGFNSESSFSGFLVSRDSL